jgi:hypothetical protein
MIPKPRTYSADLAHLPPALHDLTEQPRWVVWRWDLRTNKKTGKETWTKPPYQCGNRMLAARSNDPATWGTYGRAVQAVAAGNANGIGSMLKGSKVGAADLDHVRNEQTGELIGWARRLCVEADSLGLYREVTVSGCGLRFIGVAQGNELHRKFTFNRTSGAGIELYRDCARYITISGLQEGACEHMEPIDDYLDTLVARFDGQTAEAENNNKFDFNTAGPQIDGNHGSRNSYYRDIIENGAVEGERSEKFQEAVWHLASRGWTIEQIVDELAKHANGIGLKYSNRLLIEVARSFGKWQSQRHAGAIGTNAPIGSGSSWPQIRVVASELPRVINEAEEALLLHGAEVYQRGGLMVRPVLTKFKVSNRREAMGWHLIAVTRPWLVNTLTCAARFWKYNVRAKAWLPVDAPDKVADTYLARRGTWKLPVLAGIVHHPFLRADGSICEQPGYDAASGLLFKPEGEHYPPVPPQPSKADAIAALARLVGLIKEFPFVQDKDRAVALSAILTTLDRRAMATAPLHAFTSPVAGTGKSLLVDICAMLATGRPMPVIAQGGSEEEFEKRLGAALLAGDPAISLDNCDREVGGSFLCQVLTQQHLNIRILGLSRNVETPINATIFATGNNLVIAGDATRRVLLCAMDAGLERPETRVFSSNVIDVVRQCRGELVVAALTILRAWHVRGGNGGGDGTRIGLSPFGSFEEWSYRIREPLVWLGQIDPCETLIDVRKSDPRRDELIAVLMQWEICLGVDHKHRVQDVIGRAIGDPAFHTALINVAGARSGHSISNVSLGRWLKQVEGKIANGLALVQDGNDHGYPLWKLESR